VMAKAVCRYGFVAEPHNGVFLVSPAGKDSNGVITCYDLGGLMGSWEMKEGGVFFEADDNSCLCKNAGRKAKDYAGNKNG